MDIDAEALAMTIAELHDSTLLRSMRDNARQRWTEKCNAEKNYTDFCYLLTKLLKG